MKFEVVSDLEQSANTVCKLNVEHLVDVFFDIDDLVDPIEIGSETAYKLRIVNQGTKTANNVQLQVDFSTWNSTDYRRREYHQPNSRTSGRV